MFEEGLVCNISQLVRHTDVAESGADRDLSAARFRVQDLATGCRERIVSQLALEDDAERDVLVDLEDELLWELEEWESAGTLSMACSKADRISLHLRLRVPWSGRDADGRSFVLVLRFVARLSAMTSVSSPKC